MNKTELLDKFARSGEERLMLARALDKADRAWERSTVEHTGFLTPAEAALLGGALRSFGRGEAVFFGGYEGAERTAAIFCPEWLAVSDVMFDPDGPICAVQADFRPDSGIGHRDILGSLLGIGLSREKIGDIIITADAAQVVLLRPAAGIVLSQWETAGREHVSPRAIRLDELRPAPPEIKTVTDTVAALRLDSVCAAGFGTSRARAAELIGSGRVSLNHRECRAADRAVAAGDTVSCRGLGKFILREAGRRTKKDRVAVVIERYV